MPEVLHIGRGALEIADPDLLKTDASALELRLGDMYAEETQSLYTGAMSLLLSLSRALSRALSPSFAFSLSQSACLYVCLSVSVSVCLSVSVSLPLSRCRASCESRPPSGKSNTVLRSWVRNTDINPKP